MASNGRTYEYGQVHKEDKFVSAQENGNAKEHIKSGLKHIKTFLASLPAGEPSKELGRIFFASCEAGNREIVEHILQHHPKELHQESWLRGLDRDGRSPLMLAVFADALEIVKLLLRGPRPQAEVGMKSSKGCTALMYAKSKPMVEFLVSCGADVNHSDLRKQSVLMWTLMNNEDESIAKYLMSEQCGARILAVDDDGRSVLMTAVWKNRLQVIDSLVRRVDVDAQDKRGRTALHHLAADPKRVENGNESTALVLGRLLAARADLNKQDFSGRTCLFSALQTGNVELAKLLLKEDVDTRIESEAGWTSLHVACNIPGIRLDVIDHLIKKGADVNKKTPRGGKTPLHMAAQARNLEIIQSLLERPEVRRMEQDAHGNTPLSYATMYMSHELRENIGQLFAPWSELSRKAFKAADDRRPSAIRQADEVWSATVVDFDGEGGKPTFAEPSIYNLLYESFRSAENAEKPAFSTQRPSELTQKGMRWIHIPANNTLWCRHLLAKVFIEEGCNDVYGYRNLERSFSFQHRGRLKHLHSRYMTPMSQRLPTTAIRAEGVPEGADSYDSPDADVGEALQPIRTSERDETPPEIASSPTSLTVPDDSFRIPSRYSAGRQYRKSPSPGGSRRRAKNRGEHVGDSEHLQGDHVFMFLPYLHYETYEDVQTMAEEVKSARTNPLILENDSMGRKLFRAFLHPKNLTLHIRRTLDQFFYHNVDTKIRDADQIVHKYQIDPDKKGSPGPFEKEQDGETPNDEQTQEDPKEKEKRTMSSKILMVDQLWMWTIGNNLVVTSFPHRWKDPRRDTMDLLESIKEFLKTNASEATGTVHELASMIANDFFGTHRAQGHGIDTDSSHGQCIDETRVLDIFSACIGQAMDKEVAMFKNFQTLAANEMSRNAKGDSFQETEFVKALLNIEQETYWLNEVKDIRDELGMLRVLFGHQKHVQQSFEKAMLEVVKPMKRKKLRKAFEEQALTIDHPLQLVNSMDKQAQSIYQSIRDLLDLKQKHANAKEAGYAREQAVQANKQAAASSALAAATAVQGKILMIFTAITIVFLPLSFLATFFAIPINEFPRSGSQNDRIPLRFVASYVFGVGFVIATVAFVLALLALPYEATIGLLEEFFQRNFGRHSQSAREKDTLVRASGPESAEAHSTGDGSDRPRTESGCEAKSSKTNGKPSQPQFEPEEKPRWPGFRLAQFSFKRKRGKVSMDEERGSSSS